LNGLTAAPSLWGLTHRQALFGSAPWLAAWQAVWGSQLDPSAQTAHLYRTTQYLKGSLPVRCLRPKGWGCNQLPSMRAEYFAVCAEPAQADTQLQTWAQEAQQLAWDQWVFTDVPKQAPERHLLNEQARAAGWWLDQHPGDSAYGINTQGDFDAYLAGRGKNTRLQLLHRRKRLTSLGSIQQHNLWPDLPRFIEHLNAFHQKRWGKPCYQGQALVFLQQLLAGLEAAGHRIDCSVLYLAGQPLACALDVVVHGRAYNLQLGFATDPDYKLSLGTLMLGYRLEAAFADPSVNYYDLMAGQGKHADYKAALATDRIDFINLNLVRAPWLKPLYRLFRSRR
jgi:hypothetical protein